MSDPILDSVTKAGNVVLDRAMEMVPEGIEKESFSDTGSPAVVGLDFAATNDIDLFFIVRGCIVFFNVVMVGSVSQYVGEQSKWPVLVV